MTYSLIDCFQLIIVPLKPTFLPFPAKENSWFLTVMQFYYRVPIVLFLLGKRSVSTHTHFQITISLSRYHVVKQFWTVR